MKLATHKSPGRVHKNPDVNSEQVREMLQGNSNQTIGADESAGFVNFSQ